MYNLRKEEIFDRYHFSIYAIEKSPLTRISFSATSTAIKRTARRMTIGMTGITTTALRAGGRTATTIAALIMHLLRDNDGLSHRRRNAGKRRSPYACWLGKFDCKATEKTNPNRALALCFSSCHSPSSTYAPSTAAC